MANRDFLQAFDGRHKGGQVVTVEVVARVQAQARLGGGHGGIGVALQL